MNWLQKTREYLRVQFRRFRAWAISVLVAAGLVTGVLVNAANVGFTITMPTTYSPDADGIEAPLPLSDIDEVRMYCDGNTTPDWQMGTPTELTFTFTATLHYGPHDCVATVIAQGRESGPSEIASRHVRPTTNPHSPTLE
jgi:hypothetical protein